MEAMVQRMSATELVVGDIRTTLTAQAQNADSMRTLLEQVAAQINGVMEAHEKIHQEVADVRARGGAKFQCNSQGCHYTQRSEDRGVGKPIWCRLLAAVARVVRQSEGLPGPAAAG